MTTDGPIVGWYHHEFTPVLCEIDRLQKTLGVDGSLAEIGVYNGASFVPLAKCARPNEVVVAIDVFKCWPNPSGSGIDASFKAFAETIDTHLRGVKVVVEVVPSKQSLAMRERQFFRIVSIDGGHSAEETVVDLTLAASTLVVGGVLILDDAENPAWPGVRVGLEQWISGRPDAKVIYRGWNKTVIAFHRIISDAFTVRRG